MLLSLCLLLPALSPSSQEICSAPGSLPAPILYLSLTAAREGGSVLLQCSVISEALATRIIFCQDGEEISSQQALVRKAIYTYVHAVSRGSSGNFSCGYEIKDSKNQVNRSQLSPAQHLSLTGGGSSSGGAEEPTRPGPAMSLTIWATRCSLVLLLLVSAPIFTFVLEKRGLPNPRGLEKTPEESSSVMRGRGTQNPTDQLGAGEVPVPSSEHTMVSAAQ